MDLEQEYVKWVWADTAKSVVQAAAIYAVLLGAYWTLVA